MMNIINLLHLSLILLLFLPLPAHGYDEPPKYFMTRNEAVKSGCQLQTLKEINKENCILSEFDGHDLKITIYDANPNGEFKRTNQLIITSWYQKAKINFENLLGNGIKFIRVEAEGNTGTGTLQKILSYWGWHDDKFVPVFFETTSYYISDRYLEELKVTHEFKNQGSKLISAVLKYHYSNNNPKYKSEYTWKEKLDWQDSSFSFYNIQVENKKLLQAGNPIDKRIIKARLNQIKHKRSMSIIDTDLLNEIEIMQILYDET